MKRVSLIPYISLAFFYHLSMPFAGSAFPVIYFAPFFTTCFGRKSLFFSLWVSFFIGLFLDFCTTSTPLGFYPVCYLLIALTLHRFKVYFMEDKPLVFSLYTGIYSLLYTVIFTFLHSFIDAKFHISPLAFLMDITFLPLLDISYHLVGFYLPIAGYSWVTSREQKIRFLRVKRWITDYILKLRKVAPK